MSTNTNNVPNPNKNSLLIPPNNSNKNSNKTKPNNTKPNNTGESIIKTNLVEQKLKPQKGTKILQSTNQHTLRENKGEPGNVNLRLRGIPLNIVYNILYNILAFFIIALIFVLISEKYMETKKNK